VFIITLLCITGLRLTEDESDYLWEKRNYLYDYPSALPRIIQVSIASIHLSGLPFLMWNTAVGFVESRVFSQIVVVFFLCLSTADKTSALKMRPSQCSTVVLTLL